MQIISAAISISILLGLKRESLYMCRVNGVGWCVAGLSVPGPVFKFYECWEAISVTAQCWQLSDSSFLRTSWMAVVKVSSWAPQIQACLQSYSFPGSQFYNVIAVGAEGQLSMNSGFLLQICMHLVHFSSLFKNRVSDFSFLHWTHIMPYLWLFHSFISFLFCLSMAVPFISGFAFWVTHSQLWSKNFK